MSTDEFLSLFGARDAHEPRDPMKAAQGSMRGALPKRFYNDVGVELRQGSWVLLLDGRNARTPARQLLATGHETVASALRDEWQAQTDIIDPATMPLTRLVNAALDGVAKEPDAVRAEIVRYASSDLISYRADTPQELAALQAGAWDPLVLWARQSLDAPLNVGHGVVHIEQPAEVGQAVARAVAGCQTSESLAALSSVTTLTGSAIIALALARGRVTANEGWLAAHVDEDYQSRVWGADDEAVFRQTNRRRDFDAAMLVLSSVKPAAA